MMKTNADMDLFAKELNDLLNKHNISIVGTYNNGYQLFLKDTVWDSKYSHPQTPPNEKADMNDNGLYSIALPWGINQ